MVSLAAACSAVSSVSHPPLGNMSESLFLFVTMRISHPPSAAPAALRRGMHPATRRMGRSPPSESRLATYRWRSRPVRDTSGDVTGLRGVGLSAEAEDTLTEPAIVPHFFSIVIPRESAPHAPRKPALPGTGGLEGFPRSDPASTPERDRVRGEKRKAARGARPEGRRFRRTRRRARLGGDARGASVRARRAGRGRACGCGDVAAGDRRHRGVRVLTQETRQSGDPSGPPNPRTTSPRAKRVGSRIGRRGRLGSQLKKRSRPSDELNPERRFSGIGPDALDRAKSGARMSSARTPDA